MPQGTKSPKHSFEDRVLSRMLAMPPDPKVAPKPKKKPAKKPPKK
jgi:hypothetical protein